MRKISSIIKPGLLMAVVGVLSGCGEDLQSGLQPIPNAYGKINDLVVIADHEVWEGPLGDTLEFYYSAAYPILPQPEPIFDLRHFPPGAIQGQPSLRELRTYLIIADLSDEDSPTTQMVMRDLGDEKIRKAKEDPSYNSTVGRDKWARGQMLIYQFASSEDALIEIVKKNYPAIAKRVNEADRKRIDATIFFKGENKELQEKIKEELGADIRIPSEYFLAQDDGNVIWARMETSEISNNLLLRKVKYDNESQLSKEGIKSIRDSIGRQYISSETPNTYMKINDVDLPMFTSVKTINNNYALEARGIWEIENDFMGGPFVSYLIHSPDRNELLFVDGFVYAPGKDKRDLMQNLEYIMSTIRF